MSYKEQQRYKAYREHMNTEAFELRMIEEHTRAEALQMLEEWHHNYALSDWHPVGLLSNYYKLSWDTEKIFGSFSRPEGGGVRPIRELSLTKAKEELWKTSKSLWILISCWTLWTTSMGKVCPHESRSTAMEWRWNDNY